MIDKVKIESNITTHKIKHIGASEYKTRIELIYPDGSVDRMFQVKLISEPIPDEPKFKVGDYVRCKNTGIIIASQDDIDCISSYEPHLQKLYELWKPVIGEWITYPVGGSGEESYKTVRYTHDMQDFTNVVPRLFIQTLKEIK